MMFLRVDEDEIMKHYSKYTKDEVRTQLDEEAYQRFPSCMKGFYKVRVSDLAWAVRHELNMYEEKTPGCINDEEAKECQAYLDWLKTKGVEFR